MSTAAHTPGPWRVEEGTTLVWGDCSIDDETTRGMGYPVAEARTRLGHASPLARTFREEEGLANAHLIAAAPTMLAVLNAARIMLKNRDQRPEEIKLLDAIKAVVAEAEGRS